MKPQMDAKTFSIERYFMGCVWPLIILNTIVLAVTGGQQRCVGTRIFINLFFDLGGGCIDISDFFFFFVISQIQLWWDAL